MLELLVAVVILLIVLVIAKYLIDLAGLPQPLPVVIYLVIVLIALLYLLRGNLGLSV